MESSLYRFNNLFLYGLEFVFSLCSSSTLQGRKLKNKILQKLVKGLCIFVRRSKLSALRIKDNLRETTKKYIPMFGTLIVMMIVSNLIGLIGLQNPTSNVSFNATLAVTMWLMIQGNGIKKGGLLARMKELTEPMFLLTPLNVIGELALPISLTMRLFGNILAGYIISMLVYTLIKMLMPIGLLGLLVTPFLHMYFDIFSGVIQTYIFFTLSSFFLGQQVAIQED